MRGQGQDSSHGHYLSKRHSFHPYTIMLVLKGPLTTLCEQRIVFAYASLLTKGECSMSVMCSMAICKAKVGMCGHEKVMLSVALLAAIGFGTYFLIG